MINILNNSRRIALLFLLLFSFVYGNAQSHTTIDSLFMVKDYLNTIKKSIPNEVAEVTLKIQELDSLIRIGNKQKELFEKQLNIVLNDNATEKNDLLLTYDYILQSSILLKTDLKENQFGTKLTKKEMHYLYGKCSFLIDKIYFYANNYKIKIEESSH